MKTPLPGSDDPVLSWLLEEDAEQPGVRYFALRDLLDLPREAPELSKAREILMSSGPVPAILAEQRDEGFWEPPGPGYSPKYTGTVWQLIFLAQLGADGRDERINKACEYVLSHSLAANGVFSVNASPSGFLHCLSGNLSAALIDLGRLGDERLRKVLEQQARFVTGEGIAPADAGGRGPRYYKSGTEGPLFRCGHNARLPCAWGAVKTLLALGKLSSSERSPLIQAAIEKSVDFLLSRNPAAADYPSVYGGNPSGNWFRFGFPLGYTADVLQIGEALAGVGRLGAPCWDSAAALIESKRNRRGRWLQEGRFRGKMGFSCEVAGGESKWVTLRALRILKARRKGVAVWAQ